MLTKTVCALTTALVLAASPAVALEEGALSAMPHGVTSTPAMEAYASAHQNSVVRSRPRVVRPFTQAEQIWFEIPQGRDLIPGGY